jgi:hypothetical protein
VPLGLLEHLNGDLLIELDLFVEDTQ